MLLESVQKGEISPGKADLYRLFHLRAPERLPEVLRETQALAARAAQRPTGAEQPSRNGTAEMRLLRARLAQASADIQAEAEIYLSAAPAAAERPVAARVAGKVGSKTLRNRVITDNFSVEWGSSLTNEDGTSPAADTGPAFSGDPAVGGNGVPDVVERWAAYLEASFGVVINELDFTPDALGTSLVPVYLGNSDPDTSIDDISSSQLFGFTDYDGTGVPHLVVNNDFHALLGLTSVASIQAVMKVTAAHEFFHVLHFLYEPPVGAAVWQEEFWWWEASSTWMEDEVFDSVDDYHAWFEGPDGWASFVEAGLAPNYSDVSYDPRAYGGVIFAKYLEEHVGGRDAMRQVWESIRSGGPTGAGMRVLDAFDAYAVSRDFDGLEHLFVGFVGANAMMDYEEGDAYGQVPHRATSLASSSPPVPRYLGATYLTRPNGTGAGAEVSLAGLPATRWGLTGVLYRGASFALTLADRNPAGAPVVRFAAIGGADTAFVAPSLLADIPPISYTTTETPFASSDTTTPGPVALGSPSPTAGGFNLSWALPGDADVAGTVLRWGPSGTGSYTAFRTQFGPVTAAELRGLTPGTYDLQAFAYDTVGNADLAAAATATATVTVPGSDATVPQSGAIIPNALLKALELARPDSDGDGIPDDLDQCPGHDDAVDVDGNGTPDGCDPLIDSDGDGVSENQGDCDDGNAAIYPGATDACGDGIDQDCSGTDATCGDSTASLQCLNGQTVQLATQGGETFRRVTVVDPEALSNQTGAPDVVPYGAFDLEIETGVGATIKVIVTLPEAAPSGYVWYKHNAATGWQQFSQAAFSADRRTITLTLVDGGMGDADGLANGLIVDPSALGFVTEEEPPPASSSGGGGGGGGCFLNSLRAAH
ncbi:MAG: MopE-related protein [Deferrisomatales bacterium]|nr:MopE-related protein [Deferrisomatales bacterium]